VRVCSRYQKVKPLAYWFKGITPKIKTYKHKKFPVFAEANRPNGGIFWYILRPPGRPVYLNCLDGKYPNNVSDQEISLAMLSVSMTNEKDI
jgi:hypothetical protein